MRVSGPTTQALGMNLIAVPEKPLTDRAARATLRYRNQDVMAAARVTLLLPSGFIQTLLDQLECMPGVSSVPAVNRLARAPLQRGDTRLGGGLTTTT